jgi:hypothetical protein
VTAFEEITKFIKSNSIDARDAIFENPGFLKTPLGSEKFTEESNELNNSNSN